MSRFSFQLLFAASFLAFASCSTNGNMVAYKKVERTVIRGKTTQNEVIQLMGSPNLVTKNSRGQEVWTYTKRSYNPETGGVEGATMMSGGRKASSSGTNTANFDMILTFDSANVVRDYSVVSSEF